jgi:superfamily II DNA or RNA helicase
LGRLLRKSEGKGQARLIELVSNETSETRTSSRRKSGRKDGSEKKNTSGKGSGDDAYDDHGEEVSAE